MNRLTAAGLAMAGCVIAIDRLCGGLENTAAIILYTAAMILMIAGFIKGQKEKAERS